MFPLRRKQSHEKNKRLLKNNKQLKKKYLFLNAQYHPWVQSAYCTVEIYIKVLTYILLGVYMGGEVKCRRAEYIKQAHFNTGQQRQHIKHTIATNTVYNKSAVPDKNNHTQRHDG